MSANISNIDATKKIITENDETLSKILNDASLPALLPALAQATGDLSLLASELKPKTGLVGATLPAQGGMSTEAQEKARKLAFSSLQRLRDEEVTPINIDDEEKLKQLMEFITGKVDDDYVPLLSQELGVKDTSRPSWHADDYEHGSEFKVAVIGSGMSGLVAAYRLTQANINFTVFEKNADIGGTWLNNTYPGCRLDTSNFGYSYSFAQKADWQQQYSDRDAIYSYFRNFANSSGLMKNVVFETEVTRMTFDEAKNLWQVCLNAREGKEEIHYFNAVISAVGQLNRPNIPNIEGQEDFSGPAFHTAEWDHAVDIKGKRIAVIGTGASGVQVIPAIADEVEQLYVFQRTPPWFNPTPTYHDNIPSGLQWLLTHVPFYDRWYRFYQFWRTVEGRRPYMQVDPEWGHPISVSEKNEELRQALQAYLEGQFEDRPDLLEKVVPDYAPGAKRMPRDDGSWARTLKKENVELVVNKINKITETGIETVNGEVREVDAIIYGTGFRASEFLMPMEIKGRGGVDLHENWGGDARAYLGISLPGFPNLFCLYGPNTNLIFNGSLVNFSECGAHYILECIKTLLESGNKVMEIRREPFDDFNEKIDAENKLMSWGASSVSSWYKNAFGRVSQNWPLPSLEYWRLTRKVRLEDYIFN